jgi:hypothetical protein
MSKERRIKGLVSSLNEVVHRSDATINLEARWDVIDLPSVSRTFVRAEAESMTAFPYLVVGILASGYVLLQPFNLPEEAIKTRFNGTSTFISHSGEVIKRPEKDSEFFLNDKQICLLLKELVDSFSV